jgi:mRNA interferase MazF
MTRGKVVLVPFPFDALEATKVRPAVCLSEPVGPHRHIVLGFISSQIPESPLPTDVLLDSGQAGFSMTGLRVSSSIRLHRLVTLTASLVRRELGALPPAVMSQISDRLRLLFGL